VNSLFALAQVDPLSAAQVAGAVVLGTFGLVFLLPRPRNRSVGLGIFLTIAAAVVAVGFVVTTFGGKLATDNLPKLIEQGLFWFFTAGSAIFSIALVTQPNPARGAMAFAFVILSTCGLFLLLAAPFLMAATVIIYAGAIIVTFLFVLMLSNAKGPSDENNRSREPFLGSLAGFAFAGLIFLTLYLTAGSKTEAVQEKLLPAFPIREEDKVTLATAASELQQAGLADTSTEDMVRLAKSARNRLIGIVGSAPGEFGDAISTRTMQDRLRLAETDFHTAELIAQADALRMKKKMTLIKLEDATLDRNKSMDDVRKELAALRSDVLLLAGQGELSAKNVSSIGYALYSEHLIAVELAGTLLLVATIGSVAIANRKGVPA
jgi:NADH-quinone oxidoreductase subunit J